MKNFTRNKQLFTLIIVLCIATAGISFLTIPSETTQNHSNSTTQSTPHSSPPTQQKLPEVNEVMYPIVDNNVETTVFPSNGGQHPGVDFLVQPGTEVRATADGRIRTVGLLPPFGQRILIDHNVDGVLVSTMYGNLNADTIKVKSGSMVKAGQLLGLTADLTPDVSHLHYEIRILGTKIEALKWLEHYSK